MRIFITILLVVLFMFQSRAQDSLQYIFDEIGTEIEKELQELPELNQKILYYIDSVKGNKVNNGVCWEFIHEALKYAGAKTEVYKRFGNLFTKRRYIYHGEQIRERDALPGDIIDFCMGHQAIVYDKFEEFEYLIAHQNISVDRVVKITPLCTDCIYDRWGACHLFFRPVPKSK